MRTAERTRRWGVWLAAITKTTNAVSENGLWYGYPPWIVVLVGTVVGAAALWLLSKLLKWVLLLAMVAVLVGGLIWAARLYLE